MTKYVYFECPDCGFDSVRYRPNVTPQHPVAKRICPLCLEDSGHQIEMKSRPAKPSDRPEGFDARKTAEPT